MTTNTLTKALAKAFVAGKLDGLSDFSLIDDDAAKVIAGIGSGDDLNLSGLIKLSPVAARHLANKKGDGMCIATLYLNGLTQLPTDVAQGLSTFTGCLYLNSLKSLSADAAAFLAKSGLNALDEEPSGDATSLSLDGLTSLTPKVASALSAYVGTLSLGGLTELSCAVARKLSELNRDFDVWHPESSTLDLSGLGTLGPASAKILATTNVDYLDLQGLEVIPDTVARELSKFAGELLVSSENTSIISKYR